MAWFKVDDGFYTSQKVLSIPRDLRAQAVGVWLLAGTWSADKMTDGIVPAHILNEYGCTNEVFNALCDAGLWKMHEDIKPGDASVIRFHDWDEYQPTRQQMLDKRQETHDKKVSAGKLGAAKRWQSDSTAIAEDSRGIASDSPVPVPVPIKNTSSPAAMHFETFWSLWPRKEGKAAAVKAYGKAVRKINEPNLLLKVGVYVNSPLRADIKFVPHAATWLNGERWDDDLVATHRTVDYNDWMKSEPIELS